MAELPLNMYTRNLELTSDANTWLLLNFEGAEGSKTIIDDSPFKHFVSISTVGAGYVDPYITTVQSYEGGSSLYLINNNFPIQTEIYDWIFSGIDFTFEFAIRFKVWPAFLTTLQLLETGSFPLGPGISLSLQTDNTGLSNFYVFGNSTWISPVTFDLILDTWYYLSYRYKVSEQKIECYINGNFIDSFTGMIFPNILGYSLVIGYIGFGSPKVAYLDSLRLSDKIRNTTTELPLLMNTRNVSGSEVPINMYTRNI